MPSCYMSEDLARFGEISKANPKGWDAFLNWYQQTMAPGALDEKTKKLVKENVYNAVYPSVKKTAEMKAYQQ